MPLNNLKQALMPQGAELVPNALGTAPGYRVAHGDRHSSCCPGVPREMKPMVEETVLPWLRAQRGGDVYLARTFQTFGVTESGLDELVAGVVDPAEGRVSFRASFPEVSVRVVVHGEPDAGGASGSRSSAIDCAPRSARTATARAPSPSRRPSGTLLRERGLHGRDGGVVHRRSGRPPADERTRQLGLRARRRRRLRQRREAARCSASRRPRSTRTVR